MLSLANLLFVSSDNCRIARELMNFIVQFKTWVGIKCNANWLANLFNRYQRIVTVEVSLNDFLKGQKSVFSGTLAPVKHHNILDNYDTNDGSNCADDALPPELKKTAELCTATLLRHEKEGIDCRSRWSHLLICSRIQLWLATSSSHFLNLVLE